MSIETPYPLQIVVHKQSRQLELAFSDALAGRLSFELLRVLSPSAEVKGHGPGQEVLQTGKQSVEISRIEPIGNYALRLVFSDGHDSGIYSWDYLHYLLCEHEDLWASYLDKIEAAGASREIETPPAASGPKCGKH